MLYLGKKICGRRTVMSRYNYSMDTNMGEGRCVLRRIPCTCVACTDQLNNVWISGGNDSEQPRYADVT